MRKINIIVILIVVFVFLSVGFSFADVPDNDTVNITAYIYAPPNITFVELEDFAPYNAQPNSDIDLVAAGNKTVYCLANVSDKDGYNNLNHSSLNVTIYFAEAGYGDTNNKKFNFSIYWNQTHNTNACINQSVSGGETSYGSMYFNCSFNMPYFAENGTWTCFVKIKDISEKGPWDNLSANATVKELIALNISRESIDFGNLALGENTTNRAYNTTISNIGNVPIKVNVTAGWNYSNVLDDTYAMVCNRSYINETDIKFDADGTFTPDITGTGWNALTTGLTSTNDMTLNEPSAFTPSAEYTIFWGINLIESQNFAEKPAGICTGWLFFDALKG